MSLGGDHCQHLWQLVQELLMYRLAAVLSATISNDGLHHAGVLTSDPRLVKSARPVPLLTYDEATELAFFGATVLHPQAMQPAFQQQFHNGHRLAVRVKNSYNR